LKWEKQFRIEGVRGGLGFIWKLPAPGKYLNGGSRPTFKLKPRAGRLQHSNSLISIPE
jgi:hypothetical protein